MPLLRLLLDPLAFSLDSGMTVSMRLGVGSKWQGLQEQGVHQRVEPDPLLDLAELAVCLQVEGGSPLDLAELAVCLQVEGGSPLDLA
jgi:hypothetical protein